jgi:hypothetical protein
MGHFFGIALGFPMAIYTGLLGLALVYWLSVLVGAVHLDLDGADGAADGAVDALGGHADVDVGGHDVGGHDGDVGGHDADADADADDAGSHGGIFGALKLGNAPVTIVASLVLFFSWMLGMFGMAAIDSYGLGIGAKIALLLVVPLVSLFPTSVVIRPLARTLKPIRATKHAQLVGKLCTIRTGTVTDKFGEATLADGGAGLVVRVRVEAGDKLARGEQAVIVGYDEERGEFTVAPMPDAKSL